MRSGYLTCALLVTLAAAPIAALGNGLALRSQSASTAGTAHAGRASAARDASTIYGNPAGMSRLHRPQVTAGTTLLIADSDIAPTGKNMAPGSNNGDMVPTTLIPFGYYAQPLTNKLAVGLGFYVPFAAETDYDSSFAGRAHGLKSKIQVVTLQPTISYAINDRIAIGAGITLNQFKGTLTNAPRAAGGFTVDASGDDEAIGFNLGLLVAITDNLDWGITYHSRMDFKLTGDTEVAGIVTRSPRVNRLNGTYDASLDLMMPESVNTSLTYEAGDWTLFAGATWTRWSRLKGITVHTDGLPGVPPVPKLQLLRKSIATAHEELEWEDSWSYAVGASYQLNPQWLLRAGYAFDESPTDDEYRTVRIPASDRDIFTIGASWTPTPAVTIDVAYAHIREDKGLVEQTNSLGQVYSAEYDNSADAFSTQVTYRF